MRILIGGSHGLVGTALIKSLETSGHEVFRLVRHAPQAKTEIEWSPDRYSIALARIEGFDAVVNLAGESIAEGRWTDEKKRRIRESRVKGTKLLGDALANLASPPKTFICASAIGYYGNRGDEILTESSAPSEDFLAQVCVEWEKATALATEKGIRVVNARFGVILDANGGALKKMLPPFRMGVGGKMGDGKQWMSWIALTDVVGALNFALGHRIVTWSGKFRRTQSGDEHGVYQDAGKGSFQTDVVSDTGFRCEVTVRRDGRSVIARRSARHTGAFEINRLSIPIFAA